MKKTLDQILSAINAAFEYTFTDESGSPLDRTSSQKNASTCVIENLEFDSRSVKANTLFFALPGTHTTGNKFIRQAIEKGASAVVYQGEFSAQEKEEIASVVKNSGQTGSSPIFVKVESSRFAMSPISAAFYDDPSSRLVIYGVTGTEGKSSTVSFIWHRPVFSWRRCCQQSPAPDNSGSSNCPAGTLPNARERLYPCCSRIFKPRS